MRTMTPAILAMMLTLALGACRKDDDAEDAAEDAAKTSQAMPPADTGSMASDATTPSTMPATAGSTLMVHGTGDSAYLTDSNGRALYVLEGDDSGTRCTGDCLKSWHAVSGPTPTAGGADVQGPMIATVSRDDGTMQWTYNGHPLYYYDRDTGPGMYAGQAFSDTYGHWYLVRPNGEPMPASFPARMTVDTTMGSNDSLGTTPGAGGTNPTAEGADARQLPTQSPGAPDTTTPDTQH
jgi:predicted lipoprotein with Yx(FWY)xxD motif